jgi:peptidoglycan lytic transglycosylase D
MVSATTLDRRGFLRAVPLLVLLASIGAIHVLSSRAIAGTHVPFPRPAGLKPRVLFWHRIFTKYSWRDFVLHDGDRVWKVYGVLRLPGSGPPTPRQARTAERRLRTEYRKILTRLAAGRQPTSPTERRVAELFPDGPRDRFAVAAQNLRVQQGLRERFEKILIRSRRYLPMMKRVFKRAGLPIQLAVLSSIESGFYSRARSRAGAVGIWQFMRSTGRRYLRIDRHHDERLNPFRATVAAAKLLRRNYEALKSWPLAITAYDYGIGGTMRAAAAYHSDYLRILNEYDGSAFGFSVKNYYSEFLAALRIYSQHEYFSSAVEITGAEHDRTFQHYRVRSGDTLWRISRRYGVGVERLAEANKLDDPGELRAGRVLVIPDRTGFASRSVLRHRVRAGDTLWRISRRYHVSVGRLVRVNKLRDARHLRIGRVLVIPSRSSQSPQELTSK